MRLHYNHLFVAHNNVALTPKFHLIDAVPRLSLFHQVKLNFEIQLSAKNIQNDTIGSYKCQIFSFNINIAQFDSKLGTSNIRKISFHSCYVIQKISKLPAAIYNFQKNTPINLLICCIKAFNVELQLSAKNLQNDKIGSYKCQIFSFSINISQFQSKLGTSHNREISLHSCSKSIKITSSNLQSSTKIISN